MKSDTNPATEVEELFCPFSLCQENKESMGQTKRKRKKNYFLPEIEHLSYAENLKIHKNPHWLLVPSLTLHTNESKEDQRKLNQHLKLALQNSHQYAGGYPSIVTFSLPYYKCWCGFYLV